MIEPENLPFFCFAYFRQQCLSVFIDHLLAKVQESSSFVCHYSMFPSDAHFLRPNFLSGNGHLPPAEYYLFPAVDS